MWLLLDGDARVRAAGPLPWDTHPEGWSCEEVGDGLLDGMDLEDLCNRWAWRGGALEEVEPLDETLAPGWEPPPDASEIFKWIYTAMPALTAPIPDAMARRMRAFLPEWEEGRAWTPGCLAVRDGEVQRMGLAGWRAV